MVRVRSTWRKGPTLSQHSDLKTAQTKLGLAELKELLGGHLVEAEQTQLKRPEGCPTGVGAFDRFLLWGGLPKGELTLLRGSLGSGATSLWLDTAALAIQHKRWVAWIDGGVPLSPLSLYHKGVDLSRFVAIAEPPSEKKFLWLLQELMSSCLFEMIGCDLGKMHLREHQLRKLRKNAHLARTSLTFVAQPHQQRAPQGSMATVFSLIVSFHTRQLLIERALHRPTPHAFARRMMSEEQPQMSLTNDSLTVLSPGLSPGLPPDFPTVTARSLPIDTRSIFYARFTHHTRDCIGIGTSLHRHEAGCAHANAHSLPLSENSRASLLEGRRR